MYRNFLKALNFALSFLGTVTVGGELLKNVASIECAHLEKRHIGIGSLNMRLISYINIVYGQIC